MFSFINSVNAISADNDNLEIKNGYFSFTMPAEVQGSYYVEKLNNALCISEKISHETGEGGFAFAFKIFKSPEDYVGLDGYKKIGELTDTTGALYDMVLIRPDEVRYKDGEKIAENYDKLYKLADNIEIKGINGNIFNKNQGMKGEDLYGDILKKYKKAAAENWNEVLCQKEGLGDIYEFSKEKNKSLFKKAGYAYFDINSDGIDELFIGEITKGKKQGKIFDVYTMVNRKPKHVKSGTGAYLYVCNDRFLCTKIYRSENKNYLIIDLIESNYEKPTHYLWYTYDANPNNTSAWFKDNKSISKEEYENEIAAYSYCKKFNYIPLSKVK